MAQQIDAIQASAISLTDRAATEVRRIIGEQKLDPDTATLRVGIEGGGCSGFNYILGMDDAVRESDERFETNGIRVVVDRKSLEYINGTSIDFESGIMQRQFVFNNPNATKTCGCGTSFSV